MEFDFHANLLGFLLVMGLVVGVSVWIGYLLGRVRSLDPHPLFTPWDSPMRPFVFGAFLIGLGLFLFGGLMHGHLPADWNWPGLLVTGIWVFFLAFGGWYVSVAIRRRNVLR